MDWKAKAMIMAATQLLILRIRIMGVFMCYYMLKNRREQRSKRKRGHHYSLIEKIPKQINILIDLVHLNDRDCIDILRMDRDCFHKLCFLLQERGGLTNCRYVSVQEQTALFLKTLAHHHKNRVIRYDFKRSGQTVSHYFNKTLDALLEIYDLLIANPIPVPPNSTDEKWKGFEGCLGALDGTHIKLRAPLVDKERYRSRKGDICTNVLGVVDTNMNFVYVLAGWEGSTGDGRVLREALVREKGLKVPEGQYYLCDLGYQISDGFLTPYRGRRYHLDEWSQGTNRPRDKEEYFNMKHSKARNVIECGFGLLKGRWPILDVRTHYSVLSKCRIIMACALLHNFIRKNMTIDPMELSVTAMPREPADYTEYIDVVEPSLEWHTWREELATRMFTGRGGRRT